MELEINGCKVSGNAKDIRELLDDNREDSYLDNSNEESSKCEYCDFYGWRSSKTLLTEELDTSTRNQVKQVSASIRQAVPGKPYIFIQFRLPNGFYTSSDFNINYCPMCGRKLR